MKIYFSMDGVTKFTEAELKHLTASFPSAQLIFEKSLSYNANIIVGYPDGLTTEELKKYPDLKFIQLYSAGYNTLDLQYLANQNIRIATASGAAAIAIAEFVVASMISINRELFTYHEQKQNKLWKRHYNGIDLYGRTAAILGTGALGGEIAKRLQSFGMHTIGYRSKPDNLPFFDEIYTTSDELNDLYKRADYLILALPLTNKTNKLIDENALSKLKKTAVIVNIARGEIIDETALIAKLTNNDLRAAILDVTTVEPLPKSSPLWTLPNVFITPHISFHSASYMNRLLTIVIDNIMNYLNKQEIKTEVRI